MRPATHAFSLLISSIVLSAFFALTTHGGPAPTAVLTQHNDNARTGANLTETSLTVTNVNTNTFGLLYSLPVDDEIYAQPLIMTNVNIPAVGPRNLLIIATVNDTVYAYDADSNAGAPYWTNTFVQPPNIVAVSTNDQDAIGACGGLYQDFDNNMGIVGTPVIDPVSGTIYVVARTKEISGGQTNFFQRLHALDPTTGLDLTNSPVVINPTFPGTGDGGDGTNLTFDPLRQNQRPALLLVNGTIYVSWSSHCDNDPYHGWVIGYDAVTLQQTTAFVNTPNGSKGGIWMSGQGPSADTNGNVFLASGNGSVDTNNDYGQSLLKLTNDNSGTLKVAGFFIPPDWLKRNNNDLDLGCTGMLLVPGTSLAVSGTKYGEVFVVNRDNMAGLNHSTRAVPNPLQSWSLNSRHEIHSSPVSWTSTNATNMYIWGPSDRLRQYKLTNGKFKPVATGDKISGWPGGMISVSANGTNSGTGIIWAVTGYPVGSLRAYNAQKVTHELWDSDKVPGDAIGTFAKFVPPTVANGKVYIATWNNQVLVYGLH
jgi:hypothetical protein